MPDENGLGYIRASVENLKEQFQSTKSHEAEARKEIYSLLRLCATLEQLNRLSDRLDEHIDSGSDRTWKVLSMILAAIFSVVGGLLVWKVTKG